MTLLQRTFRTVLQLTVLTFPLVSLTGQATPPSSRLRTEFLIVGRTETAQLTIDYPRGAIAPGFHWLPTPQPLFPTASPPATLHTTLPVTIGATVVPPGWYRLLGTVDTGRKVLVLTPADSGTAAQPAVLRIPLDAEPLAPATDKVALRIQTTRHDADTVVYTSSTVRGMSVSRMQLLPASTFLLEILHGRWRLTAPVTAR